MPQTRFAACAITVGLMVLGAGVLRAQEYPSKSIRIVTAPAGGTVDMVTRLIGQELAPALGQSVVADNRPLLIGMENVAKSPPDGYSLLVAADPFWIGPLLQKLNYDPVRDFTPISLLTRAPNVLVVHPSLPVKTVRELIALAKAKPGVLNYSSSGTGASNHLAAELFKAMAGVNIVRIPYKGSAPTVTALISGEVQVMFATQSSISSYLDTGRMRALAVTTKEPSALFSGVPTVAASGVPGYEATSTQAIFAPAKTPASVVNRLNREIVQSLSRHEVKEKFLKYGLETVGTSAEELDTAMKSEMARMGKVIGEAGIKAE